MEQLFDDFIDTFGYFLPEVLFNPELSLAWFGKIFYLSLLIVVMVYLIKVTVDDFKAEVLKKVKQ